MTDRDAIRALREAIEAGRFDQPEDGLAWSRQQVALVKAVFQGDLNELAFLALEEEVESLGAAVALHEATLPGWEWRLGPSNAMIYPLNGNPGRSWSGVAGKPLQARALLIADLKAMEAQAE